MRISRLFSEIFENSLQ